MRNLPTGTVTLFFSDIEGSTQLLRQLGDRYASTLTVCRNLQRAAFQEWDGYEVDTQGDAFFVAFARATDAVSAAVDIQRTLSAHPWPQGAPVRVRIGIHTGEPQLSEEGYIGMDVHYAARIMSAGRGGQVLLSQTTRDLVAHDLPEEVSLRNLGEHRLKDIAQPGRLFQLVISGLPAEFPPLKTLDILPSRLPIQPTPFLGRTREVSEVRNLLSREDIRLLTLTGTAGVGKTRIALQVAKELGAMFPDGVFLVDLALVSDAALVVATIAQMLDIGDVKDRPLLEYVKAYLYEKHSLLILDNFEQVVAAAPVAADLLSTCPKLKILVTSRVKLHLRAEYEFKVPPLAVPDLKHLPDVAKLAQNDAVAFFVERATAAKPDFQLTAANAPIIAAICTRLDGLPLAIELAAARSRYFSPQMLLSRLEQGLSVLAGGARDLPSRQQTLRGAIAWSYELLEDEEQRVFRRLAVFVDGCTLEAAEQVRAGHGMEQEVLEVLEALVDQSLLRQEEFSDGEIRFWMLQTLREYGLERLDVAGETRAIRDAHASYFLKLAERAMPNLMGAEQATWLDRLEREHENLRVALEWMLEQAEMGEVERVLRLCAALIEFWEIRGYVTEGRLLLERALAVSKEVSTSVRAEVLYGAGFLALTQDDDIRAEALLRESLAAFRASDDKPGVAKVLRILGNLARARSNYAMARSLLEDALAIYRNLGDKKGMASTREVLAQVLSTQGDYMRVRSLLEEDLALYQAMDLRYNTAYPLYLLARMLFLSQRDAAKALTLAEESLRLSKEIGHKRLIAFVLNLLGQIFLQRGEDARARTLAAESVTIFKVLGDRFGEAEAMITLARVAFFQRKLTEAHTLYEESWALLREINAKDLSATCIEGWGEVLAAQGALRPAVRLWGLAATLRAQVGAPKPPIYRVSYGQAVAATRTKLGQEAFAAAWAEGRTMPLEQALVA